LPRLPDYEQTAGKRRAETEARSGNQAGDPVRGAEAIIKAVEAKDSPLRLLLGKPALDLAYKKLESQKANFDAWAETTRGAEFPGRTTEAGYLIFGIEIFVCVFIASEAG
jgi:hypothetical protein